MNDPLLLQEDIEETCNINIISQLLIYNNVIHHYIN